MFNRLLSRMGATKSITESSTFELPDQSSQITIKPMNFKLYLALATLFLSQLSIAQNSKTFVSEQQPNQVVQQELRQGAAWAAFTAQYGDWWVEFNEATRLPHRAVGAPIPVSGTGLEEKAAGFLSSQLKSATAPEPQLHLNAINSGRNGTYVHYQQRYNDLKIWFSHALVRFNTNNEVVMFGLDVYPDVAVSTVPSIDVQSIKSYAHNGLNGAIVSASVDPELGVLPVEKGRLMYHLVYEVMVETLEPDGTPGKFFTLVDAHSGEVLYRQNRVHTCGAHLAPAPAIVEADVEGTVTDNPLQPTANRGLPHLRVRINGTDYYTDEDGHLNENLTAPVNATVFLDGKWCEVYQGSNNNVASFNTTLNAGSNTISFDPNADDTEISAYYHVNVIHDFMTDLVNDPTYTNMDIALETNVDQPGNCNANYTGNAINFLSAGGGCPATALFSDVIYHEYGHGINYEYYDHLGGNFNNGALGEGYADVWGIMISENPILGQGFQTSPTSFVRRYDQDPKVYPQDLVGQVHADGEIIAGAWWDTYLNLGSDMSKTSQLFIESHAGVAMAPSGQEGRLYRDILLDVLLVDDDDGNLANGTPHDTAIIPAFARHGITLLTNATFTHTMLDIVPQDQPIDVDAILSVQTDFAPFVGDMELFYRVHQDSQWHQTTMTLVSGTDYTGQIPAQPKGTIVDYYITLADIFGNEALVSPFLADAPEPNLPYQALVGYQVEHLEDFDIEFGNWETDPFGIDSAQTGHWAITIPVPSYTSQFNPSPANIVQTGTDHTPNNSGNLCAVTGNAQSSSDTYGTNDVDDGHTTLQSPVFDLTPYIDPAFSYWRWYTNNQGANPGNDPWQVFITDDGTNYVRVERSYVTDRSWRRKAIRVKDYVNKTSTVSLLFIAQDSIIPSNPTFEGGSIVEGAVDDLYLYDEVEDMPSGVDALAPWSTSIFPNPTTSMLNLQVTGAEGDLTAQLTNAIGQVVEVVDLDGGIAQLDVSALAAGVYTILIRSDEAQSSHRVVVE